MEATCSSETSVDYQRTISSYAPEDRTLSFTKFAVKNVQFIIVYLLSLGSKTVKGYFFGVL
jgi:hypothetical protein